MTNTKCVHCQKKKSDGDDGDVDEKDIHWRHYVDGGAKDDLLTMQGSTPHKQRRGIVAVMREGEKERLLFKLSSEKHFCHFT